MHIHLANHTITLSLDDCHALLAAEEAIARLLPEAGVPEASFFWQLCRHAHDVVIESRGGQWDPAEYRIAFSTETPDRGLLTTVKAESLHAAIRSVHFAGLALPVTDVDTLLAAVTATPGAWCRVDRGGVVVLEVGRGQPTITPDRCVVAMPSLRTEVR